MHRSHNLRLCFVAVFPLPSVQSLHLRLLWHPAVIIEGINQCYFLPFPWYQPPDRWLLWIGRASRPREEKSMPFKSKQHTGQSVACEHNNNNNIMSQSKQQACSYCKAWFASVNKITRTWKKVFWLSLVAVFTQDNKMSNWKLICCLIESCCESIYQHFFLPLLINLKLLSISASSKTVFPFTPYNFTVLVNFC